MTLSDAAVGSRFEIDSTASAGAARRLLMLGLVDGTPVRLHASSREGGVLLDVGGTRLRVPAHLARLVRIRPLD